MYFSICFLENIPLSSKKNRTDGYWTVFLNIANSKEYNKLQKFDEESKTVVRLMWSCETKEHIEGSNGEEVTYAHHSR